MCTYLLNDIYADIFERLSNYPNMSIQEYKYSFVIVKPNGAYHFEQYLNELKKQHFHIFGFFAIKNHEKLSELLPNSLFIRGDIFMHEESKRLEMQILDKIGAKKDENVFSYNYYLESFENTKTWANVIEDSVISKIKNIIQTEGSDKDYIIVDWVFLPLCKWFENCDISICVTADYDLRLERLSKRLQDKTVYNEGDRSFWSYRPDIIQKRLVYTTLNERGYVSDYYIENNGSLDEFYNNIESFVNEMFFLDKLAV